MSEHADITKWCLATAIKHNFSLEECRNHLNDTLEAAEYDQDFLYAKYQIKGLIESVILSQKDGLYGVSHDSVKHWLRCNCE